MPWTCPNCYTEGNEGVYCNCGHQRKEEAVSSSASRKSRQRSSLLPSKNEEIILQKKDLVKSLFKDMLLHGKVIQSEVEDAIKLGKEYGYKEEEIRGIYEEVKKEVRFKTVSDIALKIAKKSNLETGKIGQLAFSIKSILPTSYNKVRLLLRFQSQDGQTVEKEYPIHAGQEVSRVLYFPYEAPKGYTEDTIEELWLYLYERETNPVVYRSVTQIIIPIQDIGGKSVIYNIQMSDNALNAGDIGEKTEKAEECAIDLYFDPEETERLAEKKEEKASWESIASPGLDSCYLEIQEKGQTRYVYLIARHKVLIGREHQSDIQPRYVDEKGEVNKIYCRLVSRQHCKILYTPKALYIQDTAFSLEHNFTEILGRKKLQNETDVLQENDVLKIGGLKLKAQMFYNHVSECHVKEADCPEEEIWEKYGGYDTPGLYSSLKLSYLNNPHNPEEYVLLYKYARFGLCSGIPISIQGPGIPDILGRFRFQQGRLWIESLKEGYNELYVNQERLLPGKLLPLTPDAKIQAGEVVVWVRTE